MIRKLSRALVALMMIVGISITATSCTSNNYNDDIIETQWDVIPITISANGWQWNNVAEQWEATIALPELDKFIFNNGAILGYVYLGTEGKDEEQVQLPFVNTYYDGVDANGNDIIFTETISYKFQIDKGKSVKFIIKSSDLFPDENAPNHYNFRIVLIW